MSEILTKDHILYWTQKWGSNNGAHSLPSISQINTLRERQTCECVKNIRTSPYTYTVGSCLFDSSMFCLLRSNFFETIIPYIDGPGLLASLYAFALTSHNNQGWLKFIQNGWLL